MRINEISPNYRYMMVREWNYMIIIFYNLRDAVVTTTLLILKYMTIGIEHVMVEKYIILTPKTIFLSSFNIKYKFL